MANELIHSKEKEELLALLLEEKGIKSSRYRAIARRETGGTPPLSFPQQRLWILEQFDPGNFAYNMPIALRLQGQLDVAALEQSLQEIIRRHEALRTSFREVDGQPSQTIADTLAFSLSRRDLAELPEAKRDAKVRQLAREEAERPFDLATGPLFRTALLRLGAEDHVLLITMHHIVSDGWSMGIFNRELAALYGAFVSQQPSPLPDLPIQYGDFAFWQRQWLQGTVLEAQLSYWRRELKDLSALHLPTDRARPSVQTFTGATHRFALSRRFTEGLYQLSRQGDVTLAILLLAAFKALLSRYTGQVDIAVGTPVANRNRSEIEGLIGFFVNSLVMRTDLSGNPRFRELLGRVRDVALGAYAHQDLPFEKLVEELHPERDQSQNPLFQVMFAVQNAPMGALELPGLILRGLGLDVTTTRFDLEWHLWERPEGLIGMVVYNATLFEAATINRMLGHFQTLLEGVVADPDMRLSDLPLLTEAERNQLLVEWNDTRRDYPKDSCIHELFEAQVDRTPEAIAVVFPSTKLRTGPSTGSGQGEGERLTYRELNGRVNRLAHYLMRRGVGPEVLVGICMERSLEMVVGILGILKAGGAYVPIDPAYPRGRIKFMLEDAKVAVLLTQKGLVQELPGDRANVLCLDTDWEVIARESEENPASETARDNLAYVIYTSGSTGKPKGVQISHGALANFLNSTRREPGLTEQDILLAVTTLSFDIAALELYLPITVGACVVLVTREVASDGIQLLDELTNSGATVMQATPATWRLLLEAGWQGSNQLKMLCGGEALPKELADSLLKRGASLWNLYGPTETTIWSTVHEVDSSETSVPIGRPIANTRLYVLDRHLNAVPVGVPGELHIGGVGLARGYLNRPELTAEKFIPDPFSGELGARLYKTGDLVRYLSDGNIEFLGRIDHQVKIRGFRIELGEIEAVLCEYPGVRETVVTARDEVPGEQRLVAYLVANEQPAPALTDLRNFLKAKLPEYMVPSTFVLLDALPLTSNGKIDRQALPMRDGAMPAPEKTFLAPSTPMESVIAEIWQDVLGVDQAGVHDNFFDLGGHSLLSMQVVSRLEKKTGLRINPGEMILSTLGQLASSCEERMRLLESREPKGFAHKFFHAIKRVVLLGTSGP